MVDMFSKERRINPKGSKNPKAKLTENDVLEILKLNQAGTSVQDIALFFPVSKSSIYRIVSHKT